MFSLQPGAAAKSSLAESHLMIRFVNTFFAFSLEFCHFATVSSTQCSILLCIFVEIDVYSCFSSVFLHGEFFQPNVMSLLSRAVSAMMPVLWLFGQQKLRGRLVIEFATDEETSTKTPVTLLF